MPARRGVCPPGRARSRRRAARLWALGVLVVALGACQPVPPVLPGPAAPRAPAPGAGTPALLPAQAATGEATPPPVLAPASDDPPGAAHQPGIGIAYGDTLVWQSPAELAATLDDAVRLGARWIRIDLDWSEIQPASPRSFDWSGVDRVVAAATARDLQVLPVLAYTPAWARPAGCDSPKCAPLSSVLFAAFAHAAAARYAPRGIHTWEVWNEQNSPAFWLPAPDATRYASLLISTVTALRIADPEAVVVSGGLMATSTRDGNIGDVEFVRRLAALGALRDVQAVGFHPYTYPHLASYVAPWPGGTATNRIDRTEVSIRAVLAEYGLSLPVWLTEYGAPTDGPGTASDGSTPVPDTVDHVTEQRQAQLATDAVRYARADANIGALFWYSDRDLGTDRADSGNFYGLLRADGSAKPAHEALRAAIAATG